MRRIEMSRHWRLILFLLLTFSAGCGGGSMSSSNPPSGSLTLSLASNSAQVFQGQASSVTVNASLVRSGTTGSVTLNVTGLPAGAPRQVRTRGGGTSDDVAFSVDP